MKSWITKKNEEKELGNKIDFVADVIAIIIMTVISIGIGILLMHLVLYFIMK